MKTHMHALRYLPRNQGRGYSLCGLHSILLTNEPDKVTCGRCSWIAGKRRLVVGTIATAESEGT